MQRLEVSGAVRPIYGSLGVKRLSSHPAATREPDGLCGNQRYGRELLTMGIMVPETC